MGKLHKDIAKHMVQCAETEDMTEEQLIKVSSHQIFHLISEQSAPCVKTFD